MDDSPPELLIFGFVHEMNDISHRIPTEIIILINNFYFETIKQNNVYSIHGVSIDGKINHKHLSYQSSTGKCRQIYQAFLDSQFQFIPIFDIYPQNKHKLLYYIRNAYPGKRYNHLLSVNRYNYRNQIAIISSKEESKTIWELIPINNQYETMKYKIKQFFPNSKTETETETEKRVQSGSYIGVERKSAGSWNILVTEENAEIYEINNINDSASSEGTLYSILYVNNMKYFSYATSSGYCRQTYDVSIESRFDFIPIEQKQNETKYRIKDIHNKDDYYFVRNAYPDERLDQWLTFQTNRNDNTCSVRLISIPDDQIKTVWKVVKLFCDVTKPQKGYEDIESKLCAYTIDDNNEFIFKGWLSVGHDQQWNVLVDREIDAKSYKLKKL